MTQIITREKDLIAESQVHLVFVNLLGKPIKIPNIILENFKPYFCDSIKT
jgi:acyl-CoA thioester hydrolase